MRKRGEVRGTTTRGTRGQEEEEEEEGEEEDEEAPQEGRYMSTLCATTPRAAFFLPCRHACAQPVHMAQKVKLCVSLSPREPHCAARAANSKILLFMHAPLQSHIGLHKQAADVQADCAARAANSKHKRFVIIIIIITTNYFVRDIIID